MRIRSHSILALGLAPGAHALALALALAAFAPTFAPGANLVATAQAADSVEAEVRAIAAELAPDLALAQKWKPTAEQIAAIAASEADAALLSAYSDAVYASISGSKAAAKPGQTEILVTGPALGDLPGGYGKEMAHFRDGVEFYGFKYVEPGQTSGMAYDGLIRVDGQWIFIPKAWRAFR
ncbi:hypothetical protein [Zavarzinia sp. CC-PAN008]|uniref:hypothetical protein n=1 Tax=Zavarzinia sp. CC-PAN008 TaxID=3243332 RepID=UPI003F743FBE